MPRYLLRVEQPDPDFDLAPGEVLVWDTSLPDPLIVTRALPHLPGRLVDLLDQGVIRDITPDQTISARESLAQAVGAESSPLPPDAAPPHGRRRRRSPGRGLLHLLR